MWTSILAPVLIVMGVTLLILGSIPIKNTIEDNTLTVNIVRNRKELGICDIDDLLADDEVYSKSIISDGVLDRKRSED